MKRPTVKQMAKRIADNYGESMNDATCTLEAEDFFEGAIERGMKEMQERCVVAIEPLKRFSSIDKETIEKVLAVISNVKVK